MTCYISRLPDQILQAIFCKLPVTSLTQCRYVCKLWQDIILNPEFVKLHLSSRKPTDLLLCVNEKSFYWLEFEGETHYVNLAAKLNCKTSSLRFLNSCNGLVCFCQDNEVLHIMNPLTCEYISYPPPCGKRMLLNTSLCGVGFDPKAEKFKVIRVSQPLGLGFSDVQVEVCTLGNGKWRSIMDVFIVLQIHDIWGRFHAFVNGSLHCLVYIKCRRQILVFDFESEQFKLMLLPHVFYDYNYSPHWTNMGVSGDSLYFCSFSDSQRLDVEIWLMKEYGIVESWTKILCMYNSLGVVGVTEIILLENGAILVSCWPHLFLCNPKTRSQTKLNPLGIGSEVYPIVGNPSFVSLKDVVGDSGKVLNARARQRTKMKI